MADINVVMKDGEIMQHGAPLDLYDDPAHQIVAGKVTLVEPTGPELQIPLDFGGQSAVVLLRGRHDIKPGATLFLTSETEKIFSFDASNGHGIRTHDPQPTLRAAGAI